jgi:hypothetical protein
VSAYDNDPRVDRPTNSSDLLHVDLGPDRAAEVGIVRRRGNSDRWAAWLSIDGDRDGWQEFATADDAIRSLIGDPR